MTELFHLKFEIIHPFIDRNGCTGRLLLNLELMKDSYPAINIKFADRRKYYDCFILYHELNGKPNPFVQMVAEYVQEALERYIDIGSL